jgi:predicted secreted protein
MRFLSRLPGIAALGLLGALCAVPAQAGDYADVEILGFSDEGFRFAFEQFGIQDGSGAPYSEIFIIDVPTDSWIETPIRLIKEWSDEYEVPDEILYATRSENRDAAGEALTNSRIFENRGRTVGLNPVTEVGSDPHRLSVYPRAYVPSLDNPMNFILDEYPLASGKCASFGAETKGFRLILDHEGAQRVLNEDTELPKSRGCPLRYRIERVVTYYPAGRPPVFAALVLMETHGFEGTNGRYLAITGTI